MTIHVKEAINKAFEWVEELYNKNELRNLLLEEVDFSDGEGAWLITIGFDSGSQIKKQSGPAVMGEVTYENQRAYKCFHISQNTGDLLRMTRAD